MLYRTCKELPSALKLLQHRADIFWFVLWLEKWNILPEKRLKKEEKERSWLNNLIWFHGKVNVQTDLSSFQYCCLINILNH